MYNHLGEQQNDSPPNDDSSSTSSLSDASVNSTHPAQVDLIPLHLSSSPDRYALSSEPQPQLDESSTIVTTLHMQKINQQLTNINSLKQSLVDDSHADAASAPFPLVSGDQHHVDDLSKSSATTSDDFVERLTLKLYQHAHSPRQTLVPSNLLPSQKTSDCPTVPDLLCEHSPSRVDMSQSNRPNTPTLPSAGAPSGAVGPADVSQIHQGLSLPVESRSTSTDTNLLGPDPPSPSTSRQRSGTPDAINTMYRIKWIRFHHQDRPIVTQNQNGPCPLLAIINILLLRGKFEFLNGKKNVTGEQLINMLADCIEDSIPNNLTPEAQLNYEQNMLDAMATFPKLSTGLDVNVKFDAIGSFEFTSELIVFDLLAIQLYHGWLVGPEEYELQAAIGHCSYNQLVEKIISNKTSNRAELVAEAFLAEDFLDKTASQLTYAGLTELIANVKEGELSILFRNNHFITLYKHKNLLYQLVTDQGFLQERNIVWETLNNIENDGVFVNGDFQPVVPEPEISPTERQEQIDKDYLIALSLEKEQTKQLQQSEQWDEYKERAGYSELTDEELALKLQKEEDERYEQMQLREQKQMKTMHIQQDPHRAQQPAYPQPESVERSMEHPPQAAVEPNSYHEQSMQMQTNQSYGSVPEDSARTRPSANSSMDSDLSSHSQRAWPDAYPPRHRSSHSKSHKKNCLLM